MIDEHIDKHEDCLFFKGAKVTSHDHKVEEWEYWKDEYIYYYWSCGCSYYEEHERCPGNQSHDSYYDCSHCKMKGADAT